MATSHCIEPLFDVNGLTQERVFGMCREHRILPQHFRCFWRFVARAEIKSTDFGNRIVCQENYNSLINKILAIVDGLA